MPTFGRNLHSRELTGLLALLILSVDQATQADPCYLGHVNIGKSKEVIQG